MAYGLNQLATGAVIWALMPTCLHSLLYQQHHFPILLQYTGNSSYTAMQISTNYNSTNSKKVGGWQATTCTSNQVYICEKQQSAYACPVINEPPEPPAMPVCE